MNYLKFFNLFLILSVLLIACEKETITDSNTNDDVQDKKTWKINDVSIVNGMMSFEDEKELSSFMSYLSKTEDIGSWLDAFEKETGFKSLRTYYFKQLDYLNEMVNKNEENEEAQETLVFEFVDQNNTYWRIDDEDPENLELVQNYDYGKFYLIANENLQYMVNDQKRTIPKDLNSNNHKNIDYFYENDEVSKSNFYCVDKLTEEFVKNKPWCKNDRRVKVRAIVYIPLSFHDFNVNYWLVEAGYEHVVWGQKKISCVWVNYKTDLDVKNSSARVKLKMDTWGSQDYFDPTDIFVTIPDKRQTDTYNIYTREVGLHGKPDNWLGQNIAPKDVEGCFTEVALEGSSRGVGDNWAIINYN